MNSDVDVTVISNILMADGIGKQGIGLLGAIHNDLSVNAYKLSAKSFKDISPDILKILMTSFKGFGKVSFWTSILGANTEWLPIHQAIDSQVRMAYVMFESDSIPDFWTFILNNYYDMAVVPDEYLVTTFKNAGVKIPIFVVPLGIMVEDLLKLPLKEKASTPFTFGMSAGFWKRKNHIKLVKAFGDKFGDDPKFKLKLHGRFGPIQADVIKAVKDIGLKNIELISAPLSVKEYNAFMEEIDCYVFPSMGEGFSITPREALAMGKPCIISNNTCQQTICKSGYVVPLEANKKVSAVFEFMGNKPCGHFFDCDVDDLSSSMKNVVNNYDKYLKQAIQGREWVKQYLWSELRPLYLSLLKPKNVVMGESNIVTPELFQTNSPTLFNKIKGLA